MHRAFFSLYFLIISAVLVAGWGLDKVLQQLYPAAAVTAAESDVLELVATELTEIIGSPSFVNESKPEQTAQMRARLDRLQQPLAARLQLLLLDDFAHSRTAAAIEKGEIVVVHNRERQKSLYYRIGDQPWVIQLVRDGPSGARPAIYDALLLVFYGAIALVVFFWVWPLSRDLRKLEKQTRLIGNDRLPETLNIGHRSTVFDLARAFNRMAERVRNLLAFHKEMTYAVSHELRTPLARMKFGLEMAEIDRDPDKFKSTLAGIREDVGEMDSLVNQLLAYASVEQDEHPLDLQHGDMSSLIEQLIDRVVATNPHTQVEFEFESHHAEGRVLCDWHLMERAILNLMQNAHRFAQSRVRVTLSQQAATNLVCVDDDGPGVPQDQRQRVFQSFIRLNNATNAKTRGFGLGLAIVQRILRWHGGRAYVTDAPLGGARFVLQWPVDPYRSANLADAEGG